MRTMKFSDNTAAAPPPAADRTHHRHHRRACLLGYAAVNCTLFNVGSVMLNSAPGAVGDGAIYLRCFGRHVGFSGCGLRGFS
jgi:hypothetical protein